MLEFNEKSLSIKIDTSKCGTCQTKACASACRKYARGVLIIDENARASTGDQTMDEILRLGTECLACEFACKFHGNDAIRIDIPITGLDDYIKKYESE